MYLRSTSSIHFCSSVSNDSLQINCYDVIGENETKTEGTLRARFEKAGACSPCVFILRNIDALSQTTQALENGKGMKFIFRSLHI